ncbi:MAG: sigma-70 family RNA polymerase sigma factor [Fibromonadaceae bacterium]|jgi:RNA polymerase sigma-70 factor (ECF subfamily)|nr:sigma-70 family RNA polymerase sigma factor [Fibromonadaceae bacterium]
MNQILNAEQLYVRYAPMVLRRCNSLLADESAAADIAQEVFVKVWEKRNSLNADYPSSLLWRMATNMCLNYIRDRKRRGENISCEEMLMQISCAEDIENEAGNRDLLTRLFKRQPESSRTIAVLHYIDGMTLEEVAKEVKMSVAGVRKRLRALKNTLIELEAL